MNNLKKLSLPKLKKLPKTGARRYEQSHHIWNVLSALVLYRNRQTITYGELAETLGYPSKAGRTLSDALGMISLYCLYNRLPPMSCIVVSQSTSMPGWEGMIPPDSTLEDEQRKVWKTRWHLYRTPSPGTFRRVREELDWPDFV